MSNFTTDPAMHQLIEERCTFLRGRLETFKKIHNLEHDKMIAMLLDIRKTQGAEALTATIDQVMPAELHSSRMPDLFKEWQPQNN